MSVVEWGLAIRTSLKVESVRVGVAFTALHRPVIQLSHVLIRLTNIIARNVLPVYYPTTNPAAAFRATLP
jgi:hypothetical protein